MTQLRKNWRMVGVVMVVVVLMSSAWWHLQW